MKKAIRRDPVPEPKPFIATISIGSLFESILVQLFSNPQKMDARMTRSAPGENENLLISSADSIMLAAVINTIARESFRPILSLNMIRAMRLVATISKLFSNATLSAFVSLSPAIREIGAAISRMTIASV